MNEVGFVCKKLLFHIICIPLVLIFIGFVLYLVYLGLMNIFGEENVIHIIFIIIFSNVIYFTVKLVYSRIFKIINSMWEDWNG